MGKAHRLSVIHVPHGKRALAAGASRAILAHQSCEPTRPKLATQGASRFNPTPTPSRLSTRMMT